MDYEKLYNESLERAKNVLNGKATDREPGTSISEYIFPVLKELEEEKIRKELVEYLKHYSGGDNISIKFPKWIAWLEKQKPIIEDEPIVIDEGKAEMDYCFTKMMNGEKVSSSWSEDDERMCNSSIRACQYMVEHFENSTKDCEDSIDWLKSLKDRVQPQWKPSEEELNALDIAKDRNDKTGWHLCELYKQLKKL